MKRLAHSRSRRLRKKLRVDEFQQMGFEVAFQFLHDLSSEQNDQFWDSFIGGAIEANHLTFGGGLSGFVVREGRDSATEAHRQIVQSWLQTNPQVCSVTVGPLLNAWHSGNAPVQTNSLGKANPAYERDDGPVSDSMLDYIRQTVPQDGFLPTSSLFRDVES